MKKITYLLLGVLLCLTSCFEDEGNYDYSKTNPPHWLNASSVPSFYAYDAREVTLVGENLFVWDTDSLQRAEEVTYEWEVNNKIVGEGINLTIDTRELMSRAGIKSFTVSGHGGTYGTFNIVEKSTGVKYMKKFQVFFYPRYSSGDWIMMIDKNNTTKLDVLISGSKYTLVENAYEETNSNQSIPGKPVSMAWAYDKHIGTQGSITVITDECAYELNAEDLVYYSDLTDPVHYLEGVPAGLKPVQRVDIDPARENLSSPATFLLSEDGKLYTRVMSPNYLGGKFLTEPYEIDDKGYDIKFFGNAMYTGIVPGYDEKNRRFVMAAVVEVVSGSQETQEILYQTKVAGMEGTPAYGSQVCDFPEGTEILYIGPANHLKNATQVFACVSNQPGSSVTHVADLLVYPSTLTPDLGKWTLNSFDLPIKLDEKSQIITSGNSRTSAAAQTMARTMLYTKGNKVYYAQRNAWASFYLDVTFGEVAVSEVTSDICYMSVAYYDMNKLFLACENGDIFIYDITNLKYPSLEYQGNVGGKVIETRQLGMHTSTSDKLNH